MFKKLILTVAYSALVAAVPALGFTKPFVMPLINPLVKPVSPPNCPCPKAFDDGVRCEKQACLGHRDDLSPNGYCGPFTWEGPAGNVRGPLGFRRPIFNGDDDFWCRGPFRRCISAPFRFFANGGFFRR